MLKVVLRSMNGSPCSNTEFTKTETVFKSNSDKFKEESMKKLVIIVLLLTMILSIVACNGTSSTPSKPPAKSVNLTFTGWRVEDQGAIDTMNGEFTKAFPNITVTYNPVKATEYDSYLQSALASGTAEDIIMMRSFGVGEVVYKGGDILPLTEELIPNLANFPAGYKIGRTAEDG